MMEQGKNGVHIKNRISSTQHLLSFSRLNTTQTQREKIMSDLIMPTAWNEICFWILSLLFKVNFHGFPSSFLFCNIIFSTCLQNLDTRMLNSTQSQYIFIKIELKYWINIQSSTYPLSLQHIPFLNIYPFFFYFVCVSFLFFYLFYFITSLSSMKTLSLIWHNMPCFPSNLLYLHQGFIFSRRLHDSVV